MRRVTVVSVLFLVVFGALRTPAFAEDYLPLAIGNNWHYQGVGGLSEDHVVTGTHAVWGTPTYVIDYQNSSSNEGLENYWTTQGGGDVLLWGWWRDIGQFGLLWQPAIPAVQAPLFLGKTWTFTATAYALPDTSILGSFDFTFEVIEAGVISVPAGDFFAYGIANTFNGSVLGSGTYHLDGTIAGSGLASGSSSWYSDGVGEVQYDADDLYQLVSLNVPTATEKTTWGSIKVIYR